MGPKADTSSFAMTCCVLEVLLPRLGGLLGRGQTYVSASEARALSAAASDADP